MASLSIGDITITWLNGGEFQLDGGTMYGAVPKALWQEKYPADQDNYIPMLNAPLLVTTPGARLVIDTGLGNKLTEKQLAIFRVTRDWSLPADLAALGIDPKEIDFVILTHGDFDHAGGVVMQDEAGKTRLTFPNAVHVLQAQEWHDITHPNIRSAHTYFPENFSGLEVGTNLHLVNGDAEITPGVHVRLSGGHTMGHQIIEMNGSGGCAVHLADVLPTHTHTNPLWIMAYDNFPMMLIELKERLLPHYQQAGCWFTFYHDVYMKACQLDTKGRITAQHP